MQNEILSVLKQMGEDVGAQDMVTVDSILKDLSFWDSLSVLNFVAEVDERFSKQISARDLADVKTVQDLIDVVNKK